MAMEVYLNFYGNCREAIAFYAKAFHLEMPVIMAYGDAPPDPEDPVANANRNLVMHTTLTICGTVVHFSDTPPEMAFSVGNNMSLLLPYPTKEEATNVFAALSEGGTIGMELQETFWSSFYGMLTDKFGIPWQVILYPDPKVFVPVQ